LLNTPHPA